MPRFLNTKGQPTLGIGICARCSRKMPLAKLYSDPNTPGLRVCLKDLDQLDPYRLPPRQPDQISLPFVRPDTDLADLPGTLYDDAYSYVPALGNSSGQYLVGSSGSYGSILLLTEPGLP